MNGRLQQLSRDPRYTYGLGLASVAAITLAIAAIDTEIRIDNISMLYLVAVILTAVALGPGPSIAASISAFLAYNEARRWSRRPEEFGKGSPEGVAAPECANNVVTGTALVPLLGLGIPGSNSAAVLMGGLMVLKRVDRAWILVRRAAGIDQRSGVMGRVFAVTAIVCASIFMFWFLIINGPGSSSFSGQGG